MPEDIVVDHAGSTIVKGTRQEVLVVEEARDYTRAPEGWGISPGVSGVARFTTRVPSTGCAILQVPLWNREAGNRDCQQPRLIPARPAPWRGNARATGTKPDYCALHLFSIWVPIRYS